MSLGDSTRLHDLLTEGDLVLLLHDGRSIKAHSFKLKFASRGGVLQTLIEDVLDDQNIGNKRKRSDSDRSDADLLSIKVRV